MSIVRALDVEGDWTFGKGRQDYLSGNRAIAQNINTRLQSFLGDCFFAVLDGIDWFSLLGSKQRLLLELSIRTTILNTAGVTGLVKLTTNLDQIARVLVVAYTVDTIYSQSFVGVPITSSANVLVTQSGDTLTSEDGSGLELG